MAISDLWKTKKPVSFHMSASNVLKIENKPSFIENKLTDYLAESGKGLISVKHDIEKFFPGKKGEGRLVDVNYFEDIYTHVPLVAAAIDLTVDFSVSPGLYVTAENDKIIESCNDLMKKLNFDILLRQIAKFMLVYGDCFVEIVKNEEGEEGVISNLKILHPATMTVVRDETGEVEGYLQDIGKGQEPIQFTSEEIVHFTYNKIGDRAYGLSIIEPIMPVLKMKLQAERDMSFILERKANAPYHVKLGNENYPPSDSDIAAFASEMAVLKARNEWVTSYLVDIGVVGTKGKTMDFKPFNEHYDNQIVYALRVPYVLLGLGNIPEGLAKIQLDTFQRHIKSIQLSIQTPLEQQIFKVESSMVSEEDVPKLQWGQQSMKEKLDEVTAYLAMMASQLSEDTKTNIENKIRDLLGIEANITLEDRQADQERKQQMFSQGGEQDGSKSNDSKGNSQGPKSTKLDKNKLPKKTGVSGNDRSVDRG